MDIPTSGVDTWLTLNNRPLSFQEDNENLDAQAHESHNNILRITDTAPDDLQIYVDDELLETERYGRWFWRPDGYAGLYLLQVRATGYLPQMAKVRVLPEKLSYKRYKAMLDDISGITIDLLFRLNSPAGEKAITQYHEQEASALRNYELVKRIVDELQDVLSSIRRSPHRVLQEHSEQRVLHEVRQFSGETRPIAGATLALPAQVTTTYRLDHLPLFWTIQQNALTYDVHENRLLKQFIQHQLVTKLSTIQEKAQNEIKRREKDRSTKLFKGWRDDETPQIEELKRVLAECQQMIKRCLAWASEPFLKSVKSLAMSGKATQVLLKHPSYSRFYWLYLHFQQELKITLNTEQYLTTLTLRKMWDLYQIWSVFHISKIIVEILTDAGYQVNSNTIFYEVEKDSFQIDVRKNVPTITLEKDDLRIEMKYEPLYPKPVGSMSGLVSTDYEQLTPDMSVEISRQGQLKSMLVFDAKYRYQEIDGSYYPKDDDLNKMRKYRDKICYKTYDPRKPNQRPQKVVSSAYILYPGTYLEHDPDEAEIGAIPLVPNMAQDDLLEVQEVIKDILWFVKLL
jgi:PD-(D/E)XK nuclease superfamily/Domain of unknown function (DUF2357)